MPVPYSCVSQKTIDGTAVTATVSANGQTITVVYQLAAPRSTASAIRIVHHVGVSGSGDPETEAAGTIPAGAVTGTLTVTTPCRAGQLDIKFVFVLSSQSQGRVGGPWIQNGTGCVPATTPTTVPQTSTSTTGSSVATTVPPSGAPETVTAPPTTGTLPVTGGNNRTAALVGLSLLFGGGALLVLTSRRLARSDSR